MLIVNTYSFASVSGAHLNPAVSLSVGLSNMGSWAHLGKFMLVQFLGSAAGVALACATYGKVAYQAIGPRPHFSSTDCFIVELIFTAMIALVYLNVTLSRSNNSVKAGNQFYGLAVGFAMAAACWAAEDVSGAIFNPALALAIDLQNISDGIGDGVFYLMAQVSGAFVAALAYRVMRPHEAATIDHDDFCARQVSKDEEGITMPKLTVEGVGTALIVFTFGMATLSTKYHDERPFAAAATLLSLHYALADVSGGHFNPAVTLSVMLNGRGNIHIGQGMAYMAVQVISASLAAGVFTAINMHNDPPTFPAIKQDSLKKYGWHALIGVDSVYTFVVCYVALATITVSPAIRTPVKRNYYDGLAYGLASAAGGFGMLNLLNTLANPALTLGEALAYAVAGEGKFWGGLFISLSQLAGAVIASLLFRFTHASLYRREALMAKDYGATDCQVDVVSKQVYEGMSSASASAWAGARNAQEQHHDDR